ncbi:MAG TPA: methyltransferase domain-containing protein [Anaerolineales bacterium]|nr:methyltransferase domain-containing protein [Anaerolineales bacterium]
MTLEKIQDKWAEWLLHKRHGDNPKAMQTVHDFLFPVRDKVLANANLKEGETLLDVGSGDGLIAFGALQKTKDSKVIFSEISQDMLDYTETIARDTGLRNRCRFVLASADDLSALAPSSVDVVTTRSVIIYVAAKQKSFKEFYHVLKSGGRISLFEPINKFGFPPPPHMFGGYDVTPVMDIAAKVRAVFRKAQPPEQETMLDFDERDILTFAERAGFKDIHMELQVSIGPTPWQTDWETYYKSSPNPKAPTLEEAMKESLTPNEADALIAHLRPLVNDGKATQRLALMYLWAVK